MHAPIADIKSNLNPVGTRWLAEILVVARDDSAAGNKNNNASNCEVGFVMTSPYQAFYIGGTPNGWR